MASRKRHRAPGQLHDYKIRLPEDIASQIAAIAKVEQRPLNRVIINRLAAFDALQDVGTLAERVRDLETILARHTEDLKVILARANGRITWLELSEKLLAAVDELLDGRNVATAIEKIRAARTVMLAEQDKK